MNIEIILIGKTKDKWIQSWEDEYLKRLNKFCKIKITIIPEKKQDDRNKCIKEEWLNILKHINKDCFICVLDETWKNLSSEALSKQITKWRDVQTKPVVFIIGGPWGLSEEIKEKSNFMLSLSKLTFTHQMIRPFFLEQLYRAFCIMNGKKYHK